MKRLVLLSSLAISALVCLSSCDKAEKGGDFKSLVPTSFAIDIVDNHFMDVIEVLGNRKMFIAAPASSGLSVKSPSAIPASDVCIVADCTVNGETYNIDGLGTMVVKIDGSTANITFTSKDGDVEVMTGTVSTIPSLSADELSLSRAWKVNNTVLSARGGEIPASVGVGKKFTGCNLEEIKEYLNANNANITEDLTGYVVKDLLFFPSGRFIIEFTGADPYVGEWDLKSSAFRYQFLFDDGDDIFNAVASGKVSFSGKKGLLEFNGSAKDNKGNAFSTNVSLVLLEL